MNKFIDPVIVPKKKLYTGVEIPCIGMGTFGDVYKRQESLPTIMKKLNILFIPERLGWKISVSYTHLDVYKRQAYTSPPLTTIRQDRIELGKCGYYALDSLLNNV